MSVMTQSELSQKIQEAKDRAAEAKNQILAKLREAGVTVEPEAPYAAQVNTSETVTLRPTNSFQLDGIRLWFTSGTVRGGSTWHRCDTTTGLVEWQFHDYRLTDRPHRHPERKAGGWDVNKIVAGILARLQEMKAALIAKGAALDRAAASKVSVDRLCATYSTKLFGDVYIQATDHAGPGEYVKIKIHYDEDLPVEQAQTLLAALRAAGLTIGGKKEA